MSTSAPVAYYNEINKGAAQWLRNLIDAGAIAPGVVDERDLRDVAPEELAQYTQCHFFAGIGVWSYALRLAGWPDDRPVWTGSCPCQPFSAAGKGAGFDDERHLWPSWHHLIRTARPEYVFGEQVASRDGLAWLDLVCADLEGEGYAVRALDSCSAGFGAPHIRQRLWIVADSAGTLLLRPGIQGPVTDRRDQEPQHLPDDRHRRCRSPRLVGDHQGERRQELRDARRSGTSGHVDRTDQAGRSLPANGHWRDADWLLCRDGRWRAVEPGTFPLVDGAPARVGRLRGYGNAINAHNAAEVIRAAAATYGF